MNKLRVTSVGKRKMNRLWRELQIMLFYILNCTMFFHIRPLFQAFVISTVAIKLPILSNLQQKNWGWRDCSTLYSPSCVCKAHFYLPYQMTYSHMQLQLQGSTALFWPLWESPAMCTYTSDIYTNKNVSLKLKKSKTLLEANVLDKISDHIC